MATVPQQSRPVLNGLVSHPIKKFSSTSVNNKISPTAQREVMEENVPKTEVILQDIIEYPTKSLPYHLVTGRGSIATGRFSDVRLACPGIQGERPINGLLDQPAAGLDGRLYAVKIPIEQHSRIVLKHEAIILSHLTRVSGAKAHVVPFFGYNSLDGSLVLQKMHCSLENLLAELDHLGEQQRMRTVAELFPQLARSLISSLAWLHDKAGVVHGDIKPANILLQPTSALAPNDSLLTRSGCKPFRPCFADFNSARIILWDRSRKDSLTGAEHLPTPPSPQDGHHRSNAYSYTYSPPTPPPSAGAATWDFMAPESLTRPPAADATSAPVAGPAGAEPTPPADVYALAMTLLVAALAGRSPFAAAAACGRTAYLRRSMVKEGRPLDFARADAECAARLESAEARGAVEAARLERALARGVRERVTAGMWAAEVTAGWGAK